MRLVMFFLMLVFTQSVFAQFIDMSEGTFEVCKGIFRDPGGAGDYNNDLNIVTTLCSINEGLPLQVHFNNFTCETNFDQLVIYDGVDQTGTLLATLTGTLSNLDFCAPSGCMTFVFVSDFSIVAAGWDAEINCAECAPLENVYTMANDRISICEGIFTDSGGYEQYMNNESFVKTICAATADVHVIVSFEFVTIESNYDYLTIYDGPSVNDPELMYLTGSNGPFEITSTDNCLTFKFTSDNSVVQAGWEATISCTEPPQSAEYMEVTTFSCYPNPSNGVFSLQPNFGGVYDLHVYNIAGECVVQKSNCIGNHVIDMKGISIGCYILEVKSGQHIARQRLFIQ